MTILPEGQGCGLGPELLEWSWVEVLPLEATFGLSPAGKALSDVLQSVVERGSLQSTLWS